ncbi:MAG: glutaredoxin family protein [Planctomycetota bacterium]
MPARTHVRIYSRRNCSLCDAVVVLVQEFAESHSLEIEIVDIDSDANLRAEFDTEVPVVEVNDREIARYRLTRERLLEAL